MPTQHSRRGFLQVAAVTGTASTRTETPTALPQVKLGKYSFSRLICGNNCFNGTSHTGPVLNEEMKRYYTPEQVMKTLRRCQESGINTWQGSFRNLAYHRQHIDEGGKLQLIAVEHGDPARIAIMAQAGCIALGHHGEATDKAFKSGQLDTIHDYLKRTRDAGMLVGVSSHMPAVFDAIESKGWDVDYYQTCIYERHRTAADLEKLLGHVPLPVGEVYLNTDPARMFKIIRQTNKPCFAFKILAAGRRAFTPAAVEAAFAETFANVKATDSVIVGMYDRLSDQPALNAALVRRYGVLPAQSVIQSPAQEEKTR